MAVPVLEIPCDAEGIFLERPNRFLGIVDILLLGEKNDEKVHVHDPGRLEELLYPGNRVLLRRAGGKNRKTKWDLIAARYEDEWILVHSGYHRAISEWVLGSDFSPFGEAMEIQPEVTVGHSRLDFVITDPEGNEIGVEVKGCTLALDGVALFPDAPTERGRRHIETLMEMIEGEKKAGLLILVFRRDAKFFLPNEATDPKFAEVFRSGIERGVMVHPLLFSYDGEMVYYEGAVPVGGG